MDKPDFDVSLDDFPALFVIPAVTMGWDGVWEGVETPLYKEFQEECRRQWYASGQCDDSNPEWLALNGLRDAYAGVDDEKSMMLANAMLARSFMDEYVLQILGDWNLSKDMEAGAKSLLAHAERYPSLFYVRCACLLSAADIFIRHDLISEAKRLYLAVLDSTEGQMITTHDMWPYIIAADEHYFRIRDGEQEASPNGIGFNPISRTQERWLRMKFERQNLGTQSEFVVATAHNAMRFKGAPGHEDEIGGTRFGGLPDVPPGWVWPEPENGIEFLAQLNFEELAPFDHNGVLPRHGLLSIFIRNLCYGWKDDGSDYLVSFYDGDMTLLQRAEAPEDFAIFGQKESSNSDLMVYRAASVEPYNIISIVDSFTLYLRGLMDGHLADQVHGFSINRNLPPGIDYYWDYHCSDQLLGFYGDGALEAWGKQTGKNYYSLEPHEKEAANYEIDKWILLLQIDSHDELGMMFSDAGIYFLMIHQDDLAARRFDRVYITMING